MGDEQAGKTLVILSGEIKTPPVSHEARREIGFLIRKLQLGLKLEMPHSRPMPSIGRRCHELRVNDAGQTWRVIYRTDPDAVVVVGLLSKKTSTTPKRVVDQAKRLLREYDSD
jgi:phage-related protein